MVAGRGRWPVTSPGRCRNGVARCQPGHSCCGQQARQAVCRPVHLLQQRQPALQTADMLLAILICRQTCWPCRKVGQRIPLIADGRRALAWEVSVTEPEGTVQVHAAIGGSRQQGEARSDRSTAGQPAAHPAPSGFAPCARRSTGFARTGPCAGRQIGDPVPLPPMDNLVSDISNTHSMTWT